jgi:hypothetical protein
LDGFEQAGFTRRIHTAHGAMALLNALCLSAFALLSADLLRPSNTDAKNHRKLCLRALARRISGQEHPSQIVIVRSRHMHRGEMQSILILSLEML